MSGKVDAPAFEAVLRGELPDGSVIAPKRGEHRPGVDLTFSVSKSVSLVAMLGGDKRIVEALQASVAATLRWAEKNIAEGRVWDGRNQKVERTGNLIAATFLHDVNRKGEPQLHVHAVIANVTQTADGKWRALHNGELWTRQHVIGTVHNADLRARIEALGYQTIPAKNPIDGSFEIAGVSRGAIEVFSTRSAEIRAALDAQGRGSARERELATLATRSTKSPEVDPSRRAEGWDALARIVGLDARGLVERAMARSERGETIWSRVMAGARGVGEKGAAVLARMGLTPRDSDPLVPERLGRLDPRSYAAAQAVASAVRQLGEREAAFDRLDLIRTALDRGGPVTVDDIEARIAYLEVKNLLITGDTRLLTTEMAQRAESRMLALMHDGKGKTAPVIAPERAGQQAQDTAQSLGLRPLNADQQRAAVLILASTDRTILVQGVSGAGKSAVLKPVVQIAQSEGRAVLGLAIAGTIAAQLAKETGAPAKTIAGFIAKYQGILDGLVPPTRLAEAQTALGGALLLVDEASQIGTAQTAELLTIAERLGVGRVALIGDKLQTGAVEAGKPFAQAQANGIATAGLPHNLRARSPIMKDVAAALNARDIERAFETLRPVTHETPREQVPMAAAAMWLALPREERDATLLLASGRAMRTAANAAAQTGLKAAGELGGPALTLQVLDRVTITREGARQDRAYQPGHVVEIRTNLPSQELARGDRGTVVGVEHGQVVLRMSDGRHQLFLPDRLPRNLRHDAVSVYALKELQLHAGDRIRWTGNDHGRELLNGQLAKVENIGADRVTILSLADGVVHELKRGDRMLERLDLAYALNVHAAQGVTTDHGIVMMSARERQLASQSAFLVAVTRIADQATLVVDSGRDLERAVLGNTGEKTSALDVGADRARAAGDKAAAAEPTREAASRPVLENPGQSVSTGSKVTAESLRYEPRAPDEPQLPVPEKYLDLSL